MDEVISWGWQLHNDTVVTPELYTWSVYVETKTQKYVRATTELKPHKAALRNAKAACRRLRHKIEGTKPRRRLSMDGSIWSGILGIPQ